MRQPPLTSPTRKQPDRQPFVPSSALRHFAPTHPKTGGCPSSTSGGRRQKACAKASDMGAATPKSPDWRILPKFAATRFSRRAPVCMRLWHFSRRETPETQSSIRRRPRFPCCSGEKSEKKEGRSDNAPPERLHGFSKLRPTLPSIPARKRRAPQGVGPCTERPPSAQAFGIRVSGNRRREAGFSSFRRASLLETAARPTGFPPRRHLSQRIGFSRAPICGEDRRGAECRGSPPPK